MTKLVKLPSMHLGVQLFTLRELIDADLPATFKQVREVGYTYVETAGLHGRTAEDYRIELDKARLKAVACHVGLPDVEHNLESTAAMAKTLGATWLIVPWIGKESYESGWATFGERLGKVAEKVIKQGLKFGYHNHDFEFAEEDGIPGFTRLWDAAPETVEVELDVYWANYAGHDPAQWLRNLAGRVPLAHFKDGKDGQYLPAGEGELDWGAIKKAAEIAGVEYAIVELDTCPRDPIDCIATSFSYFKKLGISS